jgi:hypothetical protein
MDKEYERVFTDTIDTIYNNDDIYSNLLKKEDKVIEMVNRVVNQKEREKETAVIKDASISVIVHRVFTVVFGIIHDISSLKPISVIFRRERLLYLGLFIVAVSLCFIILYKIDK